MKSHILSEVVCIISLLLFQTKPLPQGTIAGLGITFTTSATENTLAAGEYVYEVVVTDGTNVYTVVQDVYEVIESVKY